MVKQKFLSAVVALTLAGASTPASATLFLYDSFDYAAGQDLDTQTAPNSQTWDNRGPVLTTDRPVTQATNLAYAPIGAGSGGSTAFGGAGNTAAVEGPASPIVSTPGGTVYYSLVFQLTDLTGLATTGATAAALNNFTGDSTATGTVLGARLIFRPDPDLNGTYNIGTERNSGTGANFVWDTQEFDTSDVVFAVLGYTFVTGTSNDEISLWINPDSASDEATPNVTITSATVNGTDLAQIHSVMLRQGTTLAGITVDELRIADTWIEAAPVPEPVSLSVMGIGALGLLSRRSRHA